MSWQLASAVFLLYVCLVDSAPVLKAVTFTVLDVASGSPVDPEILPAPEFTNETHPLQYHPKTGGVLNMTGEPAITKGGHLLRAFSKRTEKLTLASSYKVAAITASFDRRVFVQRVNGTMCPTDVPQSLRHLCEGAAHGVTRLVCGTRLVESHPGVDLPSPPQHLVAWPFTTQFPLARVLSSWRDQTHTDPNALTFLLLLQATTVVHGETIIQFNLAESALPTCTLQFLPVSSQSSKQPALIVDENHEPYLGSQRLEQLPPQAPCSSFRPHTFPRRADWAETTQHAAKAILHDTQELIADTTQMGVLLQTNTKFAGILAGLIQPVVKPIGDLMGAVIGNTVAGIVLRPVVILTTAGLSEPVVSGVQPPLTNFLVDNITPALTETVTDTVIETLSNFLSDYITEHMTPRVTKELTASLGKTLLPKVTGEISTEGVVKMARLVAKSMSQILGRSIPHAVVASLSHSITHAPVADYYCWYCFYKKEYCEYCEGTASPSSMYYNMYYTGWYSSFYSLYYNEEKNLHVEVLQKKKTNYEDPSAFGATE